MSQAKRNVPSKELTIKRIFDAPRKLVWKAWTEPGYVMRWWGPKFFTAPVSRIDFQVGGKYLHAMRSPEGQDFWSTGVYREIVPGEKIVATDSFADEKGNIVPASRYGMNGDWPRELLVTVTFQEHDGRTTLTLLHEGIPAGEMREMTKAGWNESFDKLAEVLRGLDKPGGKASMTVDEFVKARVLPEFQPVVAMLRELMREMAPDVKEEIHYGIPAYKGRRILAVISPTRKDITFAFSRGAEFEDTFGLLQGRGNVSKHVKIKNLQNINKDALRYYIRQALELDAQ
jgi:uncharacterized protein YndB with AHSA1/START domain